MTKTLCLETLVDCIGLLEATWLNPEQADTIIAKSGGREELLAHLIKDRRALTALGAGRRSLLMQFDSVWTPREKVAVGETGGPSIAAEPLSRAQAEELLRRFPANPSAADLRTDLLHLSTLRDR